MIRSLIIGSMLLWGGALWAATPVSGRSQQMLFPRAAVQAVAAKAYQQRLAELQARGELDTDQKTLARVRQLAARLIAQGIILKPEAANWPWEVHVTSDSEVNAFAMAGGKILVGSRFVTRHGFSDDELSALLAHEIAHVIAEHIREQVSRVAAMNPPPPNLQWTVTDMINDMESDISVYFRLQPLSRLQELEADDIGIELASRAGIPPHSIETFYTKIADPSPGHSLFDSHGPSEQRETFVRNMLGYAAVEYMDRPRGAGTVYVFR